MHDAEDEYVSKSELKRQMTALQQLGEELVGLSERELEKSPIEDDDLIDAIQLARSIRSNSGRRRQLQFIGKLMRRIDATPIAQALENLHRQRRHSADAFHAIEALRDRLLAEGPAAIESVIEQYPAADRQHLRQLLRQHSREQSAGKSPASARKLFRYLRELSEA